MKKKKTLLNLNLFIYFKSWKFIRNLFNDFNKFTWSKKNR